MKKFICLVLVLSLLLTSVSAADVYKIDADASSFSVLKSSAYDVMPLDISSSDLANYLGTSSPLYLRVEEIKQILYASSGRSIMSLLDVINTNVSSIEDDVTIIGGNIDSIEADLANIWSFLYDNTLVLRLEARLRAVLGYSENSGDDVNKDLDRLFASLTQSDSPLLTSLNSLYGGVREPLYSTVSNYLGSSGAPVSGSGQSVSNLLSNGLLGLSSNFWIPSGSPHVDALGAIARTDSDEPFHNIFRDYTRAIRSFLVLRSGYPILDFDGGTFTSASDQGVGFLVASGFQGLAAHLSGSFDNSYSGISVNNQNISSPVSASGIGPMLNLWLQDIQNDLGVLSYVFASPQDIQMKEDSESNMDAVNDSFLSPESSSSVKVSDISDISSASDSIQALGDTGVTPSQAFEQLSNGDLFEFFTQETANNLDTTVSTFSRDSSQQIVTSYYEDSRLEFFDLIGKGGDG